MFSFPDETVLDPFMGSGTTASVAKKLGRNSAGYEINPELIRLNNDLIIRLIGIKQNPAINGKATEFLREKLKGKRVFLRHDEIKHDSENHLLAYLYLENKTFVKRTDFHAPIKSVQ